MYNGCHSSLVTHHSVAGKVKLQVSVNSAGFTAFNQNHSDLSGEKTVAYS